MDQPKPPAQPAPSGVPPTAPVVPPAPVVPQPQPMGGFAAPEGPAPGAPGAWSPPPADPGAWSPPTDPGAWSPPPAEPMGPATTRRKGGASAGTIALVLAGMVAVGGLGFAVGRVSAPATTTTGARGGFGGGFANGQNHFANGGALPSGGFGGLGGGRGAFGASIQGTVESIDGSSMTLKLASGQTLTVGLSSSTTYDQQTAGSASDVTSGSTVIVRLSRNGDGGPAASPGARASAGAFGSASTVTVVK
jgi:hypothetical protein